MDKVAFSARVSGTVQGVGFRYFVYQEALALELQGFVKNLIDGKVEVYAEGPREKLEQFIELLKQGPRFGAVDKVELKWTDYMGKYDTFYIDTGY
jgi:acylphosphatase